MKRKPLPSTERLRALFRYDRKTGLLYWRPRPDAPRHWNGRFAGREAGGVRLGRRIAYIKGYGSLMAARIIWKMFHGTEPEVVDHRDGNPLNDRLANLRAATRKENARNRRGRGALGIKGVYFDPKSRRWGARIYVDGRLQHLGWFYCPLDAHAAYMRAAKKLFGAFARVDVTAGMPPPAGRVPFTDAVEGRSEGPGFRQARSRRAAERSARGMTNVGGSSFTP